MRKSIVVTLGLCMAALISSGALALVAVNNRAAHTETPATEHVKPASLTEATLPTVKIIPMRDEAIAPPKAKSSVVTATKSTPATIGLDMSTMRCVKRPLSSGKPGETVTVCE